MALHTSPIPVESPFSQYRTELCRELEDLTNTVKERRVAYATRSVSEKKGDISSEDTRASDQTSNGAEDGNLTIEVQERMVEEVMGRLDVYAVFKRNVNKEKDPLELYDYNQDGLVIVEKERDAKEADKQNVDHLSTDIPGWKADVRRMIVDRSLEEMLFRFAANPDHEITTAASEDWSTKMHKSAIILVYSDLLDIILTFSEKGYADVTLPLACISSLLDMQTIQGCHYLFQYILSRVERLIKDMHPQKGKGPLLLRLLNELLRRLPKSKTSDVIFSGQILMFLSSAFPLGEKSGVNLRGNFNTGKIIDFERITDAVKELKQVAEEAKPDAAGDSEQEGVFNSADNNEEKASASMDVEINDASEEKLDTSSEKNDSVKNGEQAATTTEILEFREEKEEEEDFYEMFWSLQQFFNNPPILFASPTTSDSNFEKLQSGLRRVLMAFKEATQKEKQLLGAKESDGGFKSTFQPSSDPTSGFVKKSIKNDNLLETFEDGEAKMDVVLDGDEAARDQATMMDYYFFPNFLTSRNLLELELADSTFRRQILIQILVLFQYILSFTQVEREKAIKLPATNFIILPQYALSASNEQWIIEMKDSVLAEMSEMENGNRFRQTVELVLQREQNWINWKLRQCLPFEKAPIPAIKTSTLAKNRMKMLTRKPKPYPYALGNANLSRVWSKNMKSLAQFEPPEVEETFDKVSREWSMTKRVVKQKETMLSSLPETDSKRLSIQSELEQLDMKVKALHWRAIRLASNTHLHLFSKIGSGDLEGLIKAIDEDRRSAEEKVKIEDAGDLVKEKVILESHEADVAAAKNEIVVEALNLSQSPASKSSTPISIIASRPGTPKRQREEDNLDVGEAEREAKRIKETE